MYYKGYLLEELADTDKELISEPVFVRGILRGASGSDKETYAYLQNGDKFIKLYGTNMHFSNSEEILSLFRASSESGVEARVYGSYSKLNRPNHKKDLLTLHKVELGHNSIEFFQNGRHNL
ncbi:MAG: hypothetical protein WC867_05875 [Candidatus Pacearchaeota archaeon]|jgi:hypothetical protein